MTARFPITQLKMDVWPLDTSWALIQVSPFKNKEEKKKKSNVSFEQKLCVNDNVSHDIKFVWCLDEGTN